MIQLKKSDTDAIYREIELQYFKYLISIGGMFDNTTFKKLELLLTPILANYTNNNHLNNIAINTSIDKRFIEVEFMYEVIINGETRNSTLTLKIYSQDTNIKCNYNAYSNMPYSRVDYPFMSLQYLQDVNDWFKTFNQCVNDNSIEFLTDNSTKNDTK